MKGIKVIQTQKDLKGCGGGWFFSVGSDIINELFIDEKPFRIKGQSYLKRKGFPLVINICRQNEKYIFLSDYGIPSIHNDHKIFRYSVKTYSFLKSLVEKQDLETYRKLFVPRHCWFEADYETAKLLDSIDNEFDDFPV